MDELQPEQQLQKTDAKKKVALVIGAGDATGGGNRETFCTWWIHRLHDAKKCRKTPALNCRDRS